MKKGWKIAGTIAGLAALAAALPYSCVKDDENDKLTVQALLWKYTNQPSEEPGKRNISIDIGFHNPFAVENDDLLMDEDDDLLLMDSPAVEVEAVPQCDIELTLDPKLDDETEAASAEPEL